MNSRPTIGPESALGGLNDAWGVGERGRRTKVTATCVVIGQCRHPCRMERLDDAEKPRLGAAGNARR